MKKTTDFGFDEVDIRQKQNKVNTLFRSVSGNYDLMNDVMSLGVHRLWKSFTVASSRVRSGDKVLDLAAGSGDLSIGYSRIVGEDGVVVMTDINESMLQIGRDKVIDSGASNNIQFQVVNAEQLSFADNSFDCVSMAFGLRNVTYKEKVLKEALRVLVPGGGFQVLEFSQPVLPFLQKVYDQYSFKVIPKLGGLISDDESSYKYLVESIRKHPRQQELRQMFCDAGFAICDYTNLSGGIVALHRGIKKF